MRKIKSKKALIIIAVIGLLGLVAAAYVFTKPKSKTVIPNTGNSTKNQPSGYTDTSTASPTPVATARAQNTPQPVSSPAELSKPTLQKSSGNEPDSSVPIGRAMEFTCEGTLGATCQVILTNTAKPYNNITLPPTPIASNGRGAYFASWTWYAVSGSWTVQAKTSNGAGAVTSSDTQTLEVR